MRRRKEQQRKMSGIDCKMCCNSYNTFERRPLVLPCGHTFCSSCICVPIKEEKLTCYTCHMEHTVHSSTIFPINFEVENILHRFTTMDSNPFMGATSKMSQSIESVSLAMNREAIESRFQEANSQLQYYKTHLESWEEGCQREFQEHMEFIDRIGNILKWITNEIFRVDETLHEGEKKMQEVKDSKEKLDEVRGAQNLFEAFQKVYERYDSFDSWVRHVGASFPDKKRLQKSCQLQSTSFRKEGASSSVKSEGAAFNEKKDVCPGACSDGLDGVVGDSFSSLSIEDKIEKIMDFFPTRRKSQFTQTHEAAFLKEIDIRDISPFTEGMLRQGRVFAAQTDRDKGTTRYARISLDKSDRLWLHVLGNPEEIPCDSFLVQTLPYRPYILFGLPQVPQCEAPLMSTRELLVQWLREWQVSITR
ncbi:uncharacterized protein LOC135200268 isoform X2 [Macrobrachium nipponense]|uniref:uncharacterized protein LOC135200268 isoform X2 n=1 Tax=Macrobrachium nipponense TaxID=159736 RepID=UPI0030C7B99F